MAFNPLQSFNQGFQGGQLQKQQQLGNQISGLQQSLAGQVGQGGFNPSESLDFERLSVLDPNSAQKIRTNFESLSKDRRKAYHEDLQEGLRALESGDGNKFLGIMGDRLNAIESLKGDPTGTQFLLNKFNNGEIPELIEGLKRTEQAGIINGLLPDPEARKAKITSLTRKPALSDTEKSFKKLTSLESQLSAAKKSGDQTAIDAATNQVNNFKTLSGKFGASTQSKADIAVDKANRIALAKQASDASGEAFKGLKKIRSTILNMVDAIRALDNNADTGPIISKLPSFREASIELDNIRGRMGLDVIGSVAFGALSESELAFALDTALPTDLQPKALKAWLKRKITVQRKLAKGLRDAAVFLGKPGNTIADYIEKQELKTKELSNQGGLTTEEQEELRQLEAELGE